jgi:glutathione synthase/RimK-type ligase-like ATP-grasp enzyme
VIEPTILIFSHRDDEHIPPVIGKLRATESPFIVDLRDFGVSFAATYSIKRSASSELRLSSGEIVSLRKLKAIWWRRPTEFSQPYPEDEVFNSFIFRERQLFINGFIASLPPHVRQYNSPHHNNQLDSKLLQLAIAKSVGLDIPPTCVTSDPEAGRQFAKENDKIIYKSFWASKDFWRPTRIVSQSVLKRFQNLTICPTILQKYIPGVFDVRITVIDHQIFAASFDMKESRYPVDVRIDTKVRGVHTEVPAKLKELIYKYMRVANLRYGAFDFRAGEDGKWYFLEINPAGQFLYIEMYTKLPISQGMANALSRKADSKSAKDAVVGMDGPSWNRCVGLPLMTFGPNTTHIE